MEEISEVEFNSLITEGKSKESQIVDFKKSDILSKNIDIAESLDAFSNSFGGHLLIGVNDDGTLEGMPEKREHQGHLVNIMRDYFDPPLNGRIRIYRTQTTCSYVISVERFGVIPYGVRYGKNKPLGYFLRVGDSVRAASSAELKLLFGTGNGKQPELDVYWIDHEKKECKEINVSPKYVVRRKIPDSELNKPLTDLARKSIIIASQFENLYSAVSDEYEEDVVCLKIGINNGGSGPAESIHIWLRFPEKCELLKKPSSPFYLSQTHLQPSSGGFFIDDNEKNTCQAWMNELGNDLAHESFDEVYVRFEQKEAEYSIKGTITQNNYPKQSFELQIKVHPQVETVDVYE